MLMARHRYRAVDETGKERTGTAIALHEGDLEKRLGHKGLLLISSRPVQDTKRRTQVWRGKANVRLLIEFYRRFSQTLEMGLPIFTVLDENSRIIPPGPFRKAVEDLKSTLEDGGTLHDAMSRHPKIFSKLDVGLVRMGEESGVLPQSLADLAKFLEWKEDIRSVIKRAVIYPSFLFLAISGVIGVWVGYVLPQVGKLLVELGVELPSVTRALLASSDFLRTRWPWLALGMVSFLLPLLLLQRTKWGKRTLHRHLLHLPLIGNVVSNIASSRLCHNFSIMQRSGMTIPRIFNTLSDHLLGNRYLEERVAQAFQELQLGQSLSDSFDHAGGFPPLLVEGIRHGELTGKLEDSFKRMGEFYDGEATRMVQMLISSVEPLLIVVMGGIFGLIVISILLPLYDALSGYSQAY